MSQHTMIWLHGLGADGNDFVPIAKELRLPTSLDVRFEFPSAPIMPVTINNGYEMRAWFDIKGVDLHAEIDQDGICQSIKAIEKLIEAEIASGVDTKNIMLAGFSQGGTIALATGLQYTKTLGGIIVLSSFLPKEFLKQANPANQHTPIFIAHGMNDTLVPAILGKMMADTLKQDGYSVSWHTYAMEHSVCQDEVNDISQWVQNTWLNRK